MTAEPRPDGEDFWRSRDLSRTSSDVIVSCIEVGLLEIVNRDVGWEETSVIIWKRPLYTTKKVCSGMYHRSYTVVDATKTQHTARISEA